MTWTAGFRSTIARLVTLALLASAVAVVIKVGPGSAAVTPLTPVRISSLDTVEEDAAWSPDGTWFAFSRENPATFQDDLYVARADGTSEVRIMRGARAAAWSPDGTRLAVTRGAEIWVVNVDGTGRTQITYSLPATPANPRALYYEPSWSPDSTRIAFRYQLIEVGDSNGGTGIGVVDGDGSNEHSILHYPYSYESGESVDSVSWSPNGLIGFILQHVTTPEVSARDFYVMSDDGSDVTAVTVGQQWGDLTWSPDGDEIAFIDYSSNPSSIQIAGADGSNPTTITPPGWPHAQQPAWSPNGLDLLFGGSNYPDETNSGIYSIRLDRPAPLSGTVTEAGSGAPVTGAWVAVLNTTDFSIAAGAVTDSSGDYEAIVPPGDYFLYLIDPAGGHPAGFHGAPDTVTVTAGAATDADPTMAPTQGSIAGAVAETGSGNPIPGAWALALSTSGLPEIGTVGDNTGTFALRGLRPGNHYVAYIDPTGAHATRFYPDSPDVPHATPLTVTAGAATIADGLLPAQTTTPTGAVLSGTITQQGTSTPLPGVFVVALHAADFRIARAGTTNTSGRYTLNVAPGAYKVVFIDPTGHHNPEWHNNQPASGLADAASVTTPTVTNAALDATTGNLTGIITDDPTGTPIEGAWVVAIGPTGIAGGAVTLADGTYTITGLPPGTYRATIVDPNGGHTQEYYDNSPDYLGASVFAVAAGDTTNIDAALALP